MRSNPLFYFSKVGFLPQTRSFLQEMRGILLFYCKEGAGCLFPPILYIKLRFTVRDDYLSKAQKIIPDPMVLINVVSRRAKQLKSGYKPLIESLERLSAEDIALREVIEGKITYQLGEESQED